MRTMKRVAPQGGGLGGGDTLRMEVLNFKVTVITAKFQEFAGNLKAASRWQMMVFRFS